jgi:predicted Rossmann-fold nucleotide-binding protein
LRIRSSKRREPWRRWLAEAATLARVAARSNAERSLANSVCMSGAITGAMRSVMESRLRDLGACSLGCMPSTVAAMAPQCE